MSSAKKGAPRRLERFRAKVKVKKTPERQGRGKSAAALGKAENIKRSLELKKAGSKLVRELETLSVADLQTQLAEARQALFRLRFEHATAQLANVAAIPATKRRIARILTVIKQKEVGA